VCVLWEKVGIERYGKRVIEHARDDCCQDGAIDLDAGIGIDLYEPALALAVYHHVDAEYLEIVGSPAGVDEGIRGTDDVGSYLSDLRVDDIVEALFGVQFEHVFVELLIGEFIGALEFAVLGKALLNCVVGEVHCGLLVVQGVGVGGGPHVSLLIKVSSDLALSRCHHQVVPEVEFPPLVQQRPLYVGLQNVGALAAVVVRLFLSYAILDFLQIAAVSYVSPAVAELAGFDDPAATALF
jgi:hypothetical protein